MADGTASRVDLKLDSALPSVDKVEGVALDFAKRAGFDEDTASHVAMVAREATVNAVVHGNKYDPEKHVLASFELSDEALTVRISDQGAGVDVESLPDPLAPENLLRSSGRGIFLIKALMDEVNFRSLEPGTEVTLVKRRTAAATS